MTPQQEGQNGQAPETPRPPQQQQQEAPQSQSLLDKIVSESELVKRDAIIVRRAEFDQKQRLARMFANSGCFQDIDKDADGNWLDEEVSIARAMVKIELGESMGFSAAESMTGIDIIKGRVAVGAALRGARMQRAGFSWPQMLVTDKGCWIPLCFQGAPMMCPKVSEKGEIITDANGMPVMTQVIVSFTETDAAKAGLANKDNYKKDPSSMYYARAITRTQRRYGPGVLGVDALDTYEARDIDAPALTEITRVVPPDDDPRWFQAGSKGAAADVAEKKIRDLEERAKAKPQADPVDAVPATEATQPSSHEVEPERAKYDRDTLPEAADFPVNTECEYEGIKILRVVNDDHGNPSWKTVEEIPPSSTPRPRTMPKFGRKQ